MRKPRDSSRLVLFSAVLLLFAGCGREAKQPLRIGVISGIGGSPPSTELIEGFLEGMAARGFSEDSDVAYDIRESTLDEDVQRKVMDELLSEGIDLIVTLPTETALVAKETARNAGVPVVFAISSTEGNGLIDGIASPGEGITGVRYPTLEIVLRRYEILRELVPKMRRLALPHDPSDPRIGYEMTALRAMAAKDGIDLVEIEAATGDEMIARFEDLSVDGVPDFDAVLVVVDKLSAVIGPHLEQYCGEKDIPFGGYPYTPEVQDTLFSVGIDYRKAGLLAASLAEKIIRGAQAGELPVLSSEIHVLVNQARAAELGLEIPQAILLTADEIIRK